MYYDGRWYDTATGQFLSADPIEYDTHNLYRYVGNNPTSRKDPTGLMDFEIQLSPEHQEWLQQQEEVRAANSAMAAQMKAVADYREAVDDYWNGPVSVTDPNFMARFRERAAVMDSRKPSTPGAFEEFVDYGKELANNLGALARGVAEPVLFVADTATTLWSAATGYDTMTQMSFGFQEGGILNRVEAVNRMSREQGDGFLKRYYMSAAYGTADTIGFTNIDNAVRDSKVEFRDGRISGYDSDLDASERFTELGTGSVKFVGTGLGGMSAKGALKSLSKQITKRLSPSQVRATQELADEIASIGLPRSKQTVSLMETTQGRTIVSAGGPDLTDAQKALARQKGLLIADDMPGFHAEMTGVVTAGKRGLRPTRGVTTNKMCRGDATSCFEQFSEMARRGGYELRLNPDGRSFQFLKIGAD